MNIIFDAGNVLFYINEYRNDVYRRILNSKGYDASDIEKGIKELAEFDRGFLTKNPIVTWKDEKKWLLDRSSFLGGQIDKSNEDLCDQLYLLAFDTFQYYLYEETLSVLKEMKKRHKLYVLSNATASLDWAFDFLGIRPYFEDIIISSYVEVVKPDRKIYELTLERIGAREEACVFVDDRIENIEAALDCGIKGFHLNRNEGMNLWDFVNYVEAL